MTSKAKPRVEWEIHKQAKKAYHDLTNLFTCLYARYYIILHVFFSPPAKVAGRAIVFSVTTEYPQGGRQKAGVNVASH